METRNIFCSCGCGEKLGTMALSESISEQEWNSRLAGFTHEHCSGLCDDSCTHPNHGS